MKLSTRLTKQRFRTKSCSKGLADTTFPPRNGDNANSSTTTPKEETKTPIAIDTSYSCRDTGKLTTNRLTARKPIHLPREVTVDHQFEPPSPMKDPCTTRVPVCGEAENERLLDDSGLRLSFGNRNSNGNVYDEELLEIECHCHLRTGYRAMQRQLLDAKRLVRVILEPSHGDQQLLDTNTILHAIQSHATMKLELIELRKEQEKSDADPPCILQNLGSPAVTETACSFSVSSKQSNNKDLPINNDEKDYNSNSNNNNNSFETNTSTITRLETQLACANHTILNLQERLKQIFDRKKKRKLKTNKVTDKRRQESNFIKPTFKREELAEEDYQSQHFGVSRQNFSVNSEYHKLIENHEASLIETKKNLDKAFEETTCDPKSEIDAELVREKLKLYRESVLKHASDIRRIKLYGYSIPVDESEKGTQEQNSKLRMKQKISIKNIRAKKANELNRNHFDTDGKENKENIAHSK